MSASGTSFKRLLEFALEVLFQERCRRCGKPVAQAPEQPFSAGRQSGREPCLKTICLPCWRGFFRDAPSLDWCKLDNERTFQIASGSHYEGSIKRLVYRLKYDNDRLVARDLSYMLVKAWSRCGLDQNDQPCLIVPIPLHKGRLRKRGYNQAQLLASHAAKQIGVPVDAKALTRVKATTAQHGLGRAERLFNLEGAFRACRARVQHKIIVLVDDVFTSGATLSEAARTVTAAGAAGVLGLTVCRATLNRLDQPFTDQSP